MIALQTLMMLEPPQFLRVTGLGTLRAAIVDDCGRAVTSLQPRRPTHRWDAFVGEECVGQVSATLDTLRLAGLAGLVQGPEEAG